MKKNVCHILLWDVLFVRRQCSVNLVDTNMKKKYMYQFCRNLIWLALRICIEKMIEHKTHSTIETNSTLYYECIYFYLDI